MLFSWQEPSIRAFTQPGILAISASALDVAKRFHEEALRDEPGQDWIVSFDWSDSRRMRRPNTNDWDDLGAGIDVTAYVREHVPASAIQLIDGLEVLISIPDHILQQSQRKRIDIEGDA